MAEPFMQKILEILGFLRKKDANSDPLYVFFQETKSREKVKVIRRAARQATEEQRAVMKG